MKRWIVIACLILAVTGVVLAALPHILPRALAYHRPDIVFAINSSEKSLFITIDDAPSEQTAEILRVLKKHSVTATFFIIADHIQSPAQIDQIVNEGHSIGHHMKTTKACSRFTLDEFKRDCDITTAMLNLHGGTHLFRPPSDFGSSEQMAYVRRAGMVPVVGTVFPLDHWLTKPAAMQLLIRWLAIDGGIIVMHDGAKRGPVTASVLDQIIPQLKEAGYHFGRLSEAITFPGQH